MFDEERGEGGMCKANVRVENERLPWELGWRKREKTVGLRDVLDVVEVVRKATRLLTGDGKTGGQNDGARVARRSIHVPIG